MAYNARNEDLNSISSGLKGVKSTPPLGVPADNNSLYQVQNQRHGATR